MRFNPPFALDTLVQGFGGNLVNYAQVAGTIGHPGEDFGVAWGTPIKAVTDSYCYSIMSKDNPNLMAYRAICTIVGDSYEIIYGHCSDIFASVGPVKAGDLLANVGNTGSVFVGGVEVTVAEKNAGSHAGAHLHFQVREIKKVPADDTSYAHYLNDGSGRLVLNGFSYAVPNWNNGYNGCVDPKPFFGTTPVPFQFNKDIWMGMRNTDIEQLQRRLGLSPQTGFFGPLTFAKVLAYQKANGIMPTGFVGPITRGALNKLL